MGHLQHTADSVHVTQRHFGMEGVLLLPNISSNSWLDVLMPETTYNNNTPCCENATQTLA